MKTVFGVEWIEVEFGQRPEGWKVFLDEEECAKSTLKSSSSGAYTGGGGYFGPVRPLEMYEIPWACLEPETKKALKDSRVAWTSNRWSPKFKAFYKKIE